MLVDVSLSCNSSHYLDECAPVLVVPPTAVGFDHCRAGLDIPSALNSQRVDDTPVMNRLFILLPEPEQPEQPNH
jgi:hypothetical protein